MPTYDFHCKKCKKDFAKTMHSSYALGEIVGKTAGSVKSVSAKELKNCSGTG